MIREHGHPLQQLLDENPSFLIGGRFPHLVHIQIPKRLPLKFTLVAVLSAQRPIGG
jgi:hypothetical protein